MQPRKDTLLHSEQDYSARKEELRSKQREIKAIEGHLEGLKIHQ